ncbi:MAG TPA: hypothetical protein VGU65_04475 [Frateuria sp.]|uniref:hypothetical protein n=1 Tax=Frateuria sp. TaxID=2211372 RepID=UPI002DF63402|nr:hypothetical protein [Frateuria sp.]
MNRQPKQAGHGLRGKPSRAGAAEPTRAADAPHQDGGHLNDIRRERLDTLEWADDRTAALDPNRGGVEQDPIDDLLGGRQANADYREEANRVTPTLGPEDPAEDRGDH